MDEWMRRYANLVNGPAGRIGRFHSHHTWYLRTAVHGLTSVRGNFFSCRSSRLDPLPQKFFEPI
jgi:hypothetical protein